MINDIKKYGTKSAQRNVDLDVVITGEEIKQLFLNMPSLEDIDKINKLTGQRKKVEKLLKN
jgi:hypothetical protein